MPKHDRSIDEVQAASPPCFMHELEPGFRFIPSDMRARRDVMRWRKAERERLIAQRRDVPASERALMSERIAAGLDAALGPVRGQLISLYWPFRGEPDLRPWAASLRERGARVALPVVIEKASPLHFYEWRRSDRLVKGVWNIPVPAKGPPVVPDIVIAPVVGYDPLRYRLGYGGGFFDRTLAQLLPKPLVIGVGYAISAIATIYPFDHDIPMDKIVTDETSLP